MRTARLADPGLAGYVWQNPGAPAAQDVKDKLRSDFLSAYIAELAFWPAFQAVNFWKVPVRHQLLAVNLACLVDATFLCWCARGGRQAHGVVSTSFNLPLALPGRALSMRRDSRRAAGTCRIQNQEEDWTRYLRWGQPATPAAAPAAAGGEQGEGAAVFTALQTERQHHPSIK